jgi:hypothetical protein
LVRTLHLSFVLSFTGYHWHAREEGGSLDVDLRFKEALPTGGITVMLFGVYDALVAIDKDMNVGVSI